MEATDGGSAGGHSRTTDPTISSLTPDAVELGLGAASPAQIETGGQIGGFGRGERSRAYTFQVFVTILDGDGASIVSRSSDVA